MAFVLVSGSALKCTFKAHYTTKNALLLAASQMHMPVSHVPASVGRDFMREFCNLTAGAIKAALFQLNISCGISLPLISRGFDEVMFAADFDLPNVIYDVWQLRWVGGAISCSILYEVFDWEALCEIDASVRSDAEGDVDFL